jgi:alkylation response protein AidB-like acyl-CoA dehydrogenase
LESSTSEAQTVQAGVLDDLRRRIRFVAEGAVRDSIAEGERERCIPVAAWQAMADAGCFGRSLPREYGGCGDGIRAYAIVQEELARVWASAAVATTWANLSGFLLRHYGSDAQKEELLPSLAAGRIAGAVGFTEPHGGSDAAGIRTTATEDRDGWVLNGAKRLIDNVARADFVIATARTDSEPESRSRGISMFILRPGDPGFEVGEIYDTTGLRPIGLARFRLENCRIPADRLVGVRGRGFAQMMSMVEFGRTNVAAICVGIAQGALEEVTAFVKQRQTFGRVLATSDTIQARFADMRVQLDAARALTYRSADLIEIGDRRYDVESAVAKLHASEAAVRIASEAAQLHGGIGYTSEAAVERHLRDSRAFLYGEGTSEIMRLIIGRHELGTR